MTAMNCKITVMLRVGEHGAPEERVFRHCTRYTWAVDGSRFIINMPRKVKFETYATNVAYMEKEEDGDS